ncbi:MAG: hypothetical protein OEV44_08570 [Spirochaetota bacterium]|nr:hypothetical protein [Spirochaetota bacterium]
MKKFEVCVRGDNFLIKENKKLVKKSFYAARGIEARVPSEAMKIAIDSIKTELKNIAVVNKSDPSEINIIDVNEVYYFDNTIVYEDKILPKDGFVWTEIEQVVPINPLSEIWLKLKNSHIHTILIHFTNALYPVAVLFMLLFIFFGELSFKKTYFHIMLIATLSVPLSYISGIIEWKRKYTGAMIKIFINKIRYGLLPFIIGLGSTIWYYISPNILDSLDIWCILFILVNVSILIPIIYLSHLGGIIVYEKIDLA